MFRYCTALRQPREKAIEDAVKDYRPFRKDGVKEVDGAVLAKLKQAYKQFITNLVTDDDSPAFWYGLTGIPSRPLVPEDAGQAHDFAIKLTAHIYGRWISVQGLAKPSEPRVGSSLGRGLGEPEDGPGEEEDEGPDEYLSDLADSDIDDDQDFDEYYQNMQMATVDDDYDQDNQDPEPVIRDRPGVRQQKRGWIAHGGRRQRNGQEDEGIGITQGSQSQGTSNKRKRQQGTTHEERRSKSGRMEEEMESTQGSQSQGTSQKRKRQEGTDNGERRGKLGRLELQQEADMDKDVER